MASICGLAAKKRAPAASTAAFCASAGASAANTSA